MLVCVFEKKFDVRKSYDQSSSIRNEWILGDRKRSRHASRRISVRRCVTQRGEITDAVLTTVTVIVA